MNKITKVIASLEKTYGIPIDELVQDYGAMLTLERMAEKWNTTIHTIRTCLMALQLRRKKSHRDLDLKLFNMALSEDPDIGVKVAFATEHDVKELYRQLDVKETALNKARIELNRYKSHSRIASRNEHIFDSLTSAVENVLLKNRNIFNDTKPKVPQPVLLSTAEANAGLIAIIGDTHFGEVVKRAEVPNNEYDYEIANARLDAFVDAVLTFPRQSANLTIVNLKDTIRGVIHGGLYTSEESFIESLLRAVDFEYKMYSLFAEVYDTVTVYSTGSNHDRLTEHIQIQNKNIDYGRFIDRMVLKLLKTAGITNVDIKYNDCGYNLITINNTNIVAFHGDTLRKFNVSDANQRALLQDHCTSLLGRPYRHSINGHNHVAAVCANQYGGLSIQNGTLVGPNAYGNVNGMRTITPSQSICFVEENGAIEDIKIVDLSMTEKVSDL